MPHFDRLHPVGQVVGVQALAVLEEFEPALFFGGDLAGGEFVQLEEADPAVFEPGPAAFVAQAVTMGIGGIVAQQVVTEQPEAMGGP